MLAFRLFPPPHGMPMAGEGVPHTKCGTKRARRAAPETRAERSSLQCPPSAGGLRCGLRCAEVAAQNSPSRESLFCRDMCCGAVGSLSDTYRVTAGCLSKPYRVSIGCLHGICRFPIKYNVAEMIRGFPKWQHGESAQKGQELQHFSYAGPCRPLRDGKIKYAL